MKKHLTFNFLLFSNIMIITGIYALADTNVQKKAFLDAEAILAGWQSTYESIGSMRVLYSHRLIDYKPPAHNPDRPAPVAYSYIERVEEGKRYHMRDSSAKDTFDRPESLDEYAFDGRITRRCFGRTKSGLIVPGLTGKYPEVTNHLKYYMLLDTQRIRSYLDEYPSGIPTFVYEFREHMSTAVVRPNLESVADQLCHVVELSSVGPDYDNKYQFWVAHDKGMCLMRYRAVYNNNNKVERKIEVEQITMAKTDTGAIWYPVKAYETVVADEAGAWQKELTVKEFVPNVKVDESNFTFEFPNGTHVVDRVAGIEYTVGTEDLDSMSSVHVLELTETEQTAKKASQDIQELSETLIEERSTPSVVVTNKKKDKDESHSEPVIAKDKNKILGLKSLSILGMVVVAIFGLLFWYRKHLRV
ncbi:MAG: hypothetical protein ACETVZ_07880 [Phycisphaerae bacterium]